MSEDIELCPLCGALPCDQTHKPTAVYMILADIRIASGVNEKPMLSELATAIGGVIAARDAEIVRLRETLGRISAILYAGFAFANPAVGQVLEAIEVRERALSDAVADAMTHCTPEMQAAWTEGLKERGVDVEGGAINPPRKARV